MRKNFLTLAVILVAAYAVTGCKLYETFANSSSKHFTHSKWDPETEKYVTDDRGD